MSREIARMTNEFDQWRADAERLLAEGPQIRMTGEQVAQQRVLSLLDALAGRLGRISEIVENPDRVDDFELSESDWQALRSCSCAHCEDGDGICPMTVQQLIGNHLRSLRDDVMDVVNPPAPEMTA